MNTFSPIFPFESSVRAKDPSLGVAGQMWMPNQSPLRMPTQDFSTPFNDILVSAPKTPARIWGCRAAVLTPTIAATATVVGSLGNGLAADGITVLEGIWLALIFATFLWIAFTFFSALAGLFVMLCKPKGRLLVKGNSLNVAIISPIYNECPEHVFGNVLAMAEQFRNTLSRHRYSFFLLSDTQDPQIAALEEEAMLHLRAQMSFEFPIYYRRRVANTDRKTGNLAHWIKNWGGAYEAMLVFDADSLMSARGIHELTDELAADPTLGLVQTCPRLFGSKTIFGCMQQFSSAAFGAFPSFGEAFWSFREANYHGHNAIMRVRAFAACAGLPYLKKRNGSETLIFSHDFVEAALLRRAGWGIRMIPDLEPTYEETPTTLIDYILRDRRWCQGNMQHLRIMWSSGLHVVSRFHMGQNALTYLMSPMWFTLIILGALMGTMSGGGILEFVTGNSAASYISFGVLQNTGLWFLGLVYLMLIAPKFLGFLRVLPRRSFVEPFKGRLNFTIGFLLEVLISMAIAPILMVQQTRAIVDILLGRYESWGPQKRYGARYRMRTVWRFHGIEVALGTLLSIGIVSGVVSLWLLPVAISLSAAAILSTLSGIGLRDKNTALFATPYEYDVPAIVSGAQEHQKHIAQNPFHLASRKVAAE
jgi:membrane glycosyltransferase